MLALSPRSPAAFIVLAALASVASTVQAPLPYAKAISGIVTLARFTCQWRDALMGRTQRNQWLAEFESGTGHLENPLFLADVTMPVSVHSPHRPALGDRRCR